MACLVDIGYIFGGDCRIPVAMLGNSLEVWRMPLTDCILLAYREIRSVHTIMRHVRLANLGSTIRTLEKATPHLLQETMPKEIVHPNITFEVFPESYSLHVSGQTAYKTLQKMIQVSVCPWLIPSGSQLTILSSRLSECPEISDRRLQIHWRSVLPPERTGSSPSSQSTSLLNLEPGGLIRSLGLLPHEYPVLAGSFEFGFDTHCEHILLHILRNVEYMSKPDSELICS